MHSEHLQNVKLGWVFFGWFVALSVSSSLVLALISSGFLPRSSTAADLLVAASVAVGWFLGGFFTCYRTAAAPILHGSAIALFTFVAWFILNLALGGFTTGIEAWEEISFRGATIALLIQGVAAIAGSWVGYRYAPVRVP